MATHTEIFIFAFTYGTAFGMIPMTLARIIDRRLARKFTGEVV